MKRLLILAVLALTLTLVAAGCGSKKSSNTASTPASPPASGKGGGTKAVQVSMKNIAFNPGTVTVEKGATVVWTNNDPVNHDVTKTGGPGADFKSGSGNVAGGDTYKQTFTTPGTITYKCTIHPGMDGKIIVK
jgi:plastocyanin